MIKLKFLKKTPKHNIQYNYDTVNRYRVQGCNRGRVTGLRGWLLTKNSKLFGEKIGKTPKIFALQASILLKISTYFEKLSIFLEKLLFWDLKSSMYDWKSLKYLKSVKSSLFRPILTFFPFFEKSQLFENPKSKNPNNPGHSTLCCTLDRVTLVIIVFIFDMWGGVLSDFRWRRWSS